MIAYKHKGYLRLACNFAILANLQYFLCFTRTLEGDLLCTCSMIGYKLQYLKSLTEVTLCPPHDNISHCQRYAQLCTQQGVAHSIEKYSTQLHFPEYSTKRKLN